MNLNTSDALEAIENLAIGEQMCLVLYDKSHTKKMIRRIDEDRFEIQERRTVIGFDAVSWLKGETEITDY